MSKTATLTQALSLAAEAIRLRMSLTRNSFRKEVVRALHMRQRDRAEKRIEWAAKEVLVKQIREAANRLTRLTEQKAHADAAEILTRQIADPKRWKAELIDAVLPVLVIEMARTVVSHARLYGLDLQRKRYDPNQPRAPAGTPIGGQWISGMIAVVPKPGGGFQLPGGQPLPSHVPYIPPAWTDVRVALDPDADLLVVGRDRKGRRQAIYSEKHNIRAAALKFAKVNELRQKQSDIRKELLKDLKSRNARDRENAAVLLLIQSTGIRPGSDADTKAEKKAYGATTLEGRHVKQKKDGMYLEFVGKKGKELSIKVEDPVVVKELLARKKRAGDKGRLFDTDADKLRAYTSKKDGGGFKPKDFRTALATTLAIEQIRQMSEPKNKTEYKRAVRKVAKAVSEKLGNTPTVALQAYIDPMVFSGWRTFT